LGWTQEKLEDDPCSHGEACAIKVCMTLQLGKCAKGALGTISHICDLAPANGCPDHLKTIGARVVLDEGSNCKVGNTNYDGFSSDGKCSDIANGTSFCQIGYPGASLFFGVKDGSGSQTSQFSHLVGTGVTVLCQSGRTAQKAYAGNTNQYNFERIWTYTISMDTCNGGGGDGGGGGGGSTCSLGLDAGMDEKCVDLNLTACSRGFNTNPCTSIDEPATTDNCYMGRYCNEQGFCVLEYKGEGDGCELSAELRGSYDDQCIKEYGKCQPTGQNGATTCQVSSTVKRAGRLDQSDSVCCSSLNLLCVYHYVQVGCTASG